MKKLAMMIAVLLLTASLAACGCTDSTAKDPVNQSGGAADGSTQNGDHSGHGHIGGDHGSSVTGQPGMNGSGGVNDGIVPDIEDAVDDVGDAVGDAVDDVLPGGTQNDPAAAPGNGTVNGEPTRFQRMISNARVRDTDGILTDGENVRR